MDTSSRYLLMASLLAGICYLVGGWISVLTYFLGTLIVEYKWKLIRYDIEEVYDTIKEELLKLQSSIEDHVNKS